MDYNKKILCAALAGATFMFTGCSEDKDMTVNDLSVVEEGSAKPAGIPESTQPTAILGKGGSIGEQLSKTFTNIVEPARAKHLIVASSDLDAYEEQVVAAYQRGIVITVVDPVDAELDTWCAARGMVYSGDPFAKDRSALISFNRKAVSMSIQRKKDKGEIVEEDEVPLVIFTGWLDDVLKTTLKGPDFRSREIRKRFAPQRVSHVFPIDIPAEAVRKTGWGVPENVSLHAAAELACDIYQLHSFAGNASFTGDLYAVEAELTIHNGSLYNGRWKYSQGGKLYESSGFLLSDCGIGVSLHQRTDSGLEHSGSHVFAGGPAPASTDSSSPLQTGFEWSFDGWLTGGNGLESATPAPVQEGGWTWSNVGESVPSPLSIGAVAEGGDAVWTLSVPDDKADTASGDLTFRCSWIWGVPQATDDSEGRYYMQVDLSPVYRLIRSVQSGSGIENAVLVPEVPSARLMLIPPSRAEGQRI